MADEPRSKKLIGLLWIAAVLIAVVGVGGGLLAQRQQADQHEKVLLRIAELNAQPTTFTSSQSLGSDGVVRYTECSSDGLCTTDTVPPGLANAKPHRGGNAGIPVVDLASVCEDGVKADRAVLTKAGQEMFDACASLLARLKKS